MKSRPERFGDVLSSKKKEYSILTHVVFFKSWYSQITQCSGIPILNHMFSAPPLHGTIHMNQEKEISIDKIILAMNWHLKSGAHYTWVGIRQTAFLGWAADLEWHETPKFLSDVLSCMGLKTLLLRNIVFPCNDGILTPFICFRFSIMKHPFLGRPHSYMILGNKSDQPIGLALLWNWSVKDLSKESPIWHSCLEIECSSIHSSLRL